MTLTCLYIGIENIALPDSHRNAIVKHLQRLGPVSFSLTTDGEGNAVEVVTHHSDMPNFRCHWRIRLDGQAAIFEALFDTARVTPIAIRNRLAAIFGLSNTSISYSTAQSAYGPTVTYRYNGVNYLRLIAFGGVGASWAESHAAALAYVADNLEKWETAEAEVTR